MKGTRRSTDRAIDLAYLATGDLPGITAEFGGAIAQAAAVALDEQHHRSPTDLHVFGDFHDRYNLAWPPVNDQMRRCWNDREETTEQGAYAVAIPLVQKLTGLAVLERSRKGTRFDYWLGPAAELPFQEKARLEVSGIRNGSRSDVDGRANEKLRQIGRSTVSLPGYVIVVEFGAPLAKVLNHERS